LGEDALIIPVAGREKAREMAGEMGFLRKMLVLIAKRSGFRYNENRNPGRETRGKK
jgi:hypothetical protein